MSSALPGWLRSGWVQGLLFVLTVALLPLFFDKGVAARVPSVLLFVQIYLVLALGLNVVVGFTGLLDLGYVVFMATGAITAVFLAGLRHGPDGFDWPIGSTEAVAGELVFGFDGAFFLILVLAGLVCAVLGVLRGIPTLRVRGDYFAIVTLGFAEILYETALWDESNWLNFSRLTGGAFGAKISSPDYPTLFGDKLFDQSTAFYYLVLAVVILTFLVSHHVNDSRTGRALAAIRLDETAAKACGVNVNQYKLIAFAISGFIGGVGGALYACWAGTVAVKSLDVWQSVLILCCIVLGGMGSIRGVALGSVLLMSLGEVLREEIGGITIPPEARFLVYGFLLIVVMRFRPQGIFPANRRGTRIRGRREDDLRAGPCALHCIGPGDQEAES